MSLSQIWLYCARAGKFALPFGAAWLVLHLLWQLLRRRRIDFKRELLLLVFAVYLAALLQITVWRSGVDWTALRASAPRAAAQLTLFQTTMSHWRAGPRLFFYHVGGNLAWFVPFGLLLPAVRKRWNLAETVLLGMLLSAGIEVLQWLLRTGVTDVDDVLLNTAGAALGYIGSALARLAARPHGGKRQRKTEA